MPFTRLPMLASRGILVPLLLVGCAAASSQSPAPAARVPQTLQPQLEAIIRGYAADTAEVAVAMIDLATGDSLLIDAHEPMHAASTMKVPVMLELFRRADEGRLRLDEPLPVRNEFRSIADGSVYSLGPGDDSDSTLYGRIGEAVPLRELIERMITRSSNLATNLLIELADPDSIAATLNQFGAGEMRVLRGVEDIPAFEKGMNNSTTAYGLMKTLEAIAHGRAASRESTEEMLKILSRQEFRDKIPAGLPPGTRVANKTGWITGIDHDGAIVLPQGRAPYVLVVLTRGFTEREAAVGVAREISERVYRSLVENN